MVKQTKKAITEDLSLLDKWKDFLNIENPNEIYEEDQDIFFEKMKEFKLPPKPPTVHHLSQLSNEFLKKFKEIKKVDPKCKRCTHCHDLKEKTHVCLQTIHQFSDCPTKWVDKHETEFEDLEIKTKFYEGWVNHVSKFNNLKKQLKEKKMRFAKEVEQKFASNE